MARCSQPSCKRDAAPERKRCVQCLESNRRAHAKRRANGKTKAMKQRWKAKGLCPGCGVRKLSEGYAKCDFCNDLIVAWQIKNRARYLLCQKTVSRKYRQREDVKLRRKEYARAYHQSEAGKAARERDRMRHTQAGWTQTILRDFGG
jgi:hypothetical protein